jgi:hypothetical protein
MTHASIFVQEEVTQSLLQRSHGKTEVLPVILKSGVALPKGLDFAVQAIHYAVLFPSMRWIRAGMFGSMTVLGSAVAFLGYMHASPIDLLECPVRFLVFTDPWTRTEFVVRQVGLDREGGFGFLVLRGHFHGVFGNYDEINFVYGMYPAAPCCGWTAAGNSELATIVRPGKLKWLADDAPDMPLLRNEPFSSIQLQDSSVFGTEALVQGKPFNTNPLNARLCQQGRLAILWSELVRKLQYAFRATLNKWPSRAIQ